MKSIGMVRKLDQMGRIVLPKELRDNMEINEKDALEIFVHENSVILKKYEPACIICGDARNVENYKGKNICKECINELKNN